MLGSFFTSLKIKPDNDQIKTRRRHPRRECDKCVSVIGDKTYPVENWSMGGLQITGDDRLFSPGQKLDVIMKFKLRSNIIDIPHKVGVIRKSKGKIAFEFMPLTQKIKNNLQQVVDDYVAGKFADSHMA